MANEPEMMVILRAAAQLQLFLQPHCIAYHQYVNTAIEVLSYIRHQESFNEESGVTIDDVADGCGLHFNTAAIYLRCLERLSYLSCHRPSAPTGSAKKVYFLVGKEL